MKLYMAVPADYARHIIDSGFEGSAAHWLEAEDGTVSHYCPFRDQPPGGLVLSRTAEIEADVTGDAMALRVSGGALLADDLGDFVMSIDVPGEMAAQFEVHEEPPAGWPFREYWLPADIANAHLGDGEEVRPDLVGR